MSNVTNIILIATSLDGFTVFNEMLEKLDLDGVRPAPRGFNGGPKNLECVIHAAAYNGLGEEREQIIVELFYQYPWTDPEQTTLLIIPQEGQTRIYSAKD